ncbi:MAG: hypothetical protein M0Z75_10325, partial [Nitrospiraceae bacterium]|nr:hypothetical protein [Nitrospiraceae bacterium]
MNIRHYIGKDPWDSFVAASAASHCYHQIGWKRVIEKSFGHRTYYLLAEDGAGKILGILPLVHLASVLFGNFIVSMPYFNYGGICADTPEAGRELFKEAVRIAEKEGAEHIEMRHTRPTDLDVKEKRAKVSMKLSLPGTSGEL